MSRAGKASLAAGVAIAGTAAFLDLKGPHGHGGTGVDLKDFSVPAQPGRTISIVRSSDRIESVGKAIELLGGIDRFVKSGDKVVLKPNVGFASPPMLGATTNPEIIGEVTRLCFKAGAATVSVMDNPINDPASCFTISGIEKAAREAGARIVMPTADRFSDTTLQDGQLIRNWPLFYEPLKDADKLIGIAPVKDHHRSGATMSMKNWYGLLGGSRNIFHQDINAIIAELAMLVRPTLVILDGTEVMVSNGPTGGSRADLKRMDTMIASCDQVAADTYAAGLLDMKPSDLRYLSKAQQAGVGTTDYESLKPIIVTLSKEMNA